MATTTPKLGLILPAGQEKVSRQVINDNMVKIDQASLNRSEFVFNPEVMKEAISAITGVQSVDIFMNRAEDEAGGIPGESIMVFVHNGSAASIAQAIYDTNTSGLETAGSIVRTVEETEVRFSRPTLNIIYPTITIEADYAAPDVSTLGTPIKTAVYNYINSLGLGGTLHTEHLKEAIKASVGATLASTFNISKVQISGDFGIMYDGVITPEWNAKYAVFSVDSVTVVSQVNPHSKAIATQRTAMSYLVNGNMSTEAIPAGAYFQLVNSLITGRSDGEYTASKAIPANTAIDSTYFNESAPITGGGLNSLNSKIASHELMPSSYININSAFTITHLRCVRITPTLLMVYYDIAGTIKEGETVIGTATSNIKNANYGAGRVSTSSGTYPASIAVIGNGGAVRIHSPKAGTASAGSVLVMIGD